MHHDQVKSETRILTEVEFSIIPKIPTHLTDTRTGRNQQLEGDPKTNISLTTARPVRAKYSSKLYLTILPISTTLTLLHLFTNTFLIYQYYLTF